VADSAGVEASVVEEECPAAAVPLEAGNSMKEREVNNDPIRVLYVSGTEQNAHSAADSLTKFEGAQFEVVLEERAEKALEYLEQQPAVDVIMTEDILPGMSGLEFTRKLRDMKFEAPVVFLTTSQDVNLAVEVMRLGVKDYLLKQDIASHILPQSLLRIVEKVRLRREVSELEVKQKRLEAMQEIVVDISDKISEPLQEMSKIVGTLEQYEIPEKAAKYLKLIKDNVLRMEVKLEKLRNLKEDKTVKYIRDIKMIDLS
jgi:PleD family two-component response regulator